MLQSTLDRHHAPVVYLAVATISLPAGMLVARSGQGVSMSLVALAGLAGLVLLVSMPPTAFFVGWFLLAPLFQSAADTTALGRGLTWALYIAPALLMVFLIILRRDHSVELSKVDFLPGAYLLYVLVSIATTTELLHSNPTGSMKALVLIVGIGVIVYYYLTIGPGAEIAPRTLVAALLAAGIVQGAFAILDGVAGWNLWGYYDWQDTIGGARAVGTLTSPALLGMFLGCAMMAAIAVLTWGGPRSLRWPSVAVLVLGVPGLLLTLTRGPILAVALAAVLLLVFGRWRLLAFALLAVAAVAIVLLLPSFKKTDLYTQRVAETSNVEFRVVIREWSLRLAAQKPIFGWGYGSFDRVKRNSGFYAEGVPLRGVLELTSHDTYLTVLVELGSVGLALFALPFVLFGLKGIARARAPSPNRWIIATCLGSFVVIFITASTVDIRFFSIGQMLPFFFLAILRRVVSSPPARL